MSYTKVTVSENEPENSLEFKDADSGEPLESNDMLYILLDDGSYKLIGDSGEVSFSSDLDHVKNGSETFGSLEDLRNKIYKGPYQDITSDAVNPIYVSPLPVISPVSPLFDMQHLAAAAQRRRRTHTRVAARRNNRRVRSRNNRQPATRQPATRQRRVVVARRASNRRRTPRRRRLPVATAARRTRPSLQPGK